jgi:nucleotide-binding universal stress UspA family protein
MIALHVITPDQLPMFGDQPVHETEAWTEEFGRRVLLSEERDVKLEIRVGDAPQTVRKVAKELGADLVVLAWHRNLGQGHGQLVRSMLSESEIPVLLYPIG